MRQGVLKVSAKAQDVISTRFSSLDWSCMGVASQKGTAQVVRRQQTDVQNTAEQPRKVAFALGAPGSGKSTQCERLAREFGLLHLNAGALLRRTIEEGGQHSKELAAIIGAGKIVHAHVRTTFFTMCANVMRAACAGIACMAAQSA
jgi:Adenylate kinase